MNLSHLLRCHSPAMALALLLSSVCASVTEVAWAKGPADAPASARQVESWSRVQCCTRDATRTACQLAPQAS